MATVSRTCLCGRSVSVGVSIIHVDLFHFVTGMVLGVECEVVDDCRRGAIRAGDGDLLFRHFHITMFDPVMAAAIGFLVVAVDYLLTACTSLVVVSAVSIVGVILVVGLLVTPAATAYLLCDRLAKMMALAALFGVTGVTGGLYISLWIGNVATGPSMVIVSTLQFLIVLLVAPRYGLIADWWRCRTLVPQQTIEDVLVCFRYADFASLAPADIQRRMPGQAVQIARALRQMHRDELLEEKSGRWHLTTRGKHEAQRLLCADRLWETYLQHVGTPADQLHQRASVLEHVHDEETVDYLDDKL